MTTAIYPHYGLKWVTVCMETVLVNMGRGLFFRRAFERRVTFFYHEKFDEELN